MWAIRKAAARTALRRATKADHKMVARMAQATAPALKATITALIQAPNVQAYRAAQPAAAPAIPTLEHPADGRNIKQ